MQAYQALVPAHAEDVQHEQRVTAVLQTGQPLADDPTPQTTLTEVDDIRRASHEFAWLGFWDILVFFGVLLVGFAYLWRRGDLAWVRSLSDRQQAARAAVPPPSPLAAGQELVGSGR